jgi:seryl-tRNA synthetase
MEVEEQKTKSTLDTKLMAIGNVLHESVPVAANEANNVTLRAFGDRRTEQNLMNHVDLCATLDIVDLKRGVAGSRPPVGRASTLGRKARR